MAKRKMIFCEPCSFKMIIESGEIPDILVPIKTSTIQTSIPQLDKTGKTSTKPDLEQCKKFKCPKCGRGVVMKDLQQAFAKTYIEIDARKEKERLEKDRQKRIEDGKPEVKNQEAIKEQQRLEQERIERFKKSRPDSK